MKQQVYQTTLAGGIATKLPQNPQNAGEADNLVIDKTTGGWSTRIGYETWKPGATSWVPFATCGPISSLHVAQAVAGGARQHVLFEESGNLQLLYEADGADQLVTLATGRHVPAPTEAGSWYTDTGHGTIITNGVDRPVLVNPWPLPRNGAGLTGAPPRSSGTSGSTACPHPLSPGPSSPSPQHRPPTRPSLRATGGDPVVPLGWPGHP